MATSALEQVFIDTITKSTAVGGEIYDGIRTCGVWRLATGIFVYTII